MKRITATTILLALFVACCIFSHSCAKTSSPPSGGPKDTIPPVLLKITPENEATGFPVTDGKISLLYNEYTVVKTASDILLSPPTKRKPTAKVKGKNIVVSFTDTLREEQTYTLDFGQALADNNEGNLAPRLVYTFSTGDSIDSLYFTGTVIDSRTLVPVKGALVAAYTDLSDSACFLSMPDAIVRTDDWGYFAMRNIRDTTYRIYAYSNTAGDYKYNPDGDQVAFLDSVYEPKSVVNDSIYELKSFLMKDTLACQARKSMITLLMFKELQSVQYLQNSGRRTEKQGFLKFSAADVQINSLEFVGIDSSAVILQYNRTRDSLDFWINVDYKLDDSLLVRVNYMKTDSTGVLSPFEENLSLPVMPDEVALNKDLGGDKGKEKDKKQRDTTFQLTVKAQDETVEQLGVRIESALPVIKVQRDSLVLKETNPKGQVSEMAFKFEQDTSDIRRYIVTPDRKLIKGYDYELTIAQGAFINLDKLPNAAASAKFKVPQSETLSLLQLKLTGVDGNYIVDLTDDKGSNVFRTYIVNSDRTLDFPYLKAGKYMIRIASDQNVNGLSDTGNLLAHRQPEPVRFYETTPGNKILDIPESVEIEQHINIKEMFR